MAIAGVGIRIWGDGQLIINQWKGQATTPIYRNHASHYGTR